MRCSLVFLAALSLVACGDDDRPGRDGGGGGDGGGGVDVAGCNMGQDADGDGIADDLEGTGDLDGDGTPNFQDDDSDGDGILDRDEASDRPCRIRDTDGDGTPDWWDGDSDNDGLSDAEEVGTFNTDPRNRDTDMDGVTDLGEARGTMTDPTDPTSTIDVGDFFVVLPFNGPRENRRLQFGTDINIADVYFLIDTTGSMGAPIANVQSSLTTLAEQIRARIPNLEMGVGQFRDLPLDACGSGGILGGFGTCGSPGDMGYAHEQDITPDVASVQTALNGLSAGGGADGPESHVVGLFHAATGLGATYTHSSGSWSLPPRTCPSRPDETTLRTGYPCFRPGALPIFVVVTDVEMHNGPTGENPYEAVTPPPPTFASAMSALGSIGARFIGVAVNGGGRAHLEEAARQTGTVDGTGRPLVEDAAGGTVTNSILDAIGTLTGGVAQDVSTRTQNVPGNPDEFDATTFIKAITPVEGFREGVPGTGYDSFDDTTFYNVIPGTIVEFSVEFLNDVRPPAETAQIFRARIVVVGNGVTDLDSREVYIIVPPDGATILI
ncbi:MAG: hypothetical protein AAGE52_02350 [Myxococcota bacterium]